jgi:glycosyltransferase involved in cell wall biosynthesis
MKIVCVIPALNESGTIKDVLSCVKDKVDVIVVVDDGSIDDTAKIAASCGAIVLSHPTNRGQGAALETGNEYARRIGADVVVHFDADGQFSASEIRQVTAPIESGEADAVFGSRFSGKKNKVPFLKEKIIMPIARVFNRIFFGLDMKDPQSGFRALSSKVLLSLTIEHDGMAHCSEILHKVSCGGWRIKEVPISVSYSEFGQTFGGGIKIVKDIFIGKLLK